MPKPFPKEFRDDVVAVARKGDSSVKQVAADFGISESCVHGWLKKADIEDGARPGVTAVESAELREVKKRNRVSTSPMMRTCASATRRSTRPSTSRAEAR